MASLNSVTLFLCLQAVLALTTIPASHCNTIKPRDYQLIESVCRRTPNFNVCIQSLRSSPGSSSADITGLALIMVNVMKARATSALNQIHRLQKGTTGSVHRALSSCASKYNAILVGDIPQATYALQAGDPKFAEDGANDAGYEANECEREFGGHSPLTQQNNAMYNVASFWLFPPRSKKFIHRQASLSICQRRNLKTPHRNQDGVYDFGIMKLPNSKTTSILKVPAFTEATTVWKIEAMDQNTDTDVRCSNRRRNRQKNLAIFRAVADNIVSVVQMKDSKQEKSTTLKKLKYLILS